ncbi:MAG: transglutaminase family protein [Anaerolineaceae bacterium]
MANNNQNWWDFPAAVFLLAAIWFAGIRLDATDWIEHLELVEFLATSGCILGLIIGKSRLNSMIAKLIGLGYSLIILPWQLSLAAPLNEKYADRLAEIIGRLYTSIVQFTNNQRLDDPIFFLASISLLYWSFSLISGYMLTRYGRPWFPLVAAGVVLVMIEFYHVAGSLGWESGAFAISLLLLAGRLHFVNLKKLWEEKNLAVDSETGTGLGKGVLIISLVIVLTAWNLPIFSPVIWKQVLSSSPDLLTPLSWQERLTKIVAALNQPPNQEGDSFGGYMGLGRAASTGNNTIFTAAVIESNAPGARFYWRARSYDFYDNGSWVNSQDSTIDLAADEERFVFEERSGRQAVITQLVISAASVRNLFTAGEPLKLSLPVKVIGEITPAGIEDVNAVTAQENLLRGGSYRQSSLVSNPSKQLLRETSQNYPAWVQARYLQLPAGLTQRTRDLAAQITAGMNTPYDKADAITAWLRKEITYENTIPNPPVDREVMDWFLFDHKAGYCNFYATAEVVLLRSLGIPSRLAAGYAQGNQDPETGLFQVLRKDSHAWPEVYFPGVGWVEFEPTTSQPELLFREMDSLETAPNQDPLTDDEIDKINNLDEERMDSPIPEGNGTEQSALAAFWESRKAVIIFLLALLITAGLTFLVHRFCTKRKTTLPALIARFLQRLGLKVPGWLNYLAYYFYLSPVSRSFMLVPVYIRLLGGKKPAGATPAESVRMLNEQEPATTYYSQLLLVEFEKENFSPKPADLEAGAEAAEGLESQIFKTLWQRLIRW